MSIVNWKSILTQLLYHRVVQNEVEAHEQLKNSPIHSIIGDSADSHLID